VVRSSASESETKPTPQLIEFLQGADEVEQRPPPTIEPPDHNDIELAAAGRFEHRLALWPHIGAGADVAHLHADAPATLLGVGAHRAQLHRQRLLIVGGDAGVEPRPQRFGPGQKPSVNMRGKPAWLLSRKRRIGGGRKL
jgi:hypothetical protein